MFFVVLPYLIFEITVILINSRLTKQFFLCVCVFEEQANFH